MTKRELETDVARDLGMRRDQVTAVVNSFVEHIRLALRAREMVTLRNFGTFQVTRRNPQSKERIKFTPATRYKLDSML